MHAKTVRQDRHLHLTRHRAYLVRKGVSRLVLGQVARNASLGRIQIRLGQQTARNVLLVQYHSLGNRRAESVTKGTTLKGLTAISAPTVIFLTQLDWRHALSVPQEQRRQMTEHPAGSAQKGLARF